VGGLAIGILALVCPKVWGARIEPELLWISLTENKII
jgi:hypothetical protein